MHLLSRKTKRRRKKFWKNLPKKHPSDPIGKSTLFPFFKLILLFGVAYCGLWNQTVCLKALAVPAVLSWANYSSLTASIGLSIKWGWWCFVGIKHYINRHSQCFININFIISWWNEQKGPFFFSAWGLQRNHLFFNGAWCSLYEIRQKSEM